MTAFFLIATIVTVVLNVLSHWNLSRGNNKTVYILNLFVYASYFAIETALAFNDPSQIGILLFNVLNLWAFSMAVKGLLRLRREKNASEVRRILQEAQTGS